MKQYNSLSLQELKSAFLRACYEGQLENVKYLISNHGIDIDYLDGQGFLSASNQGHLHIIKYLLSLERKTNLYAIFINDNNFAMPEKNKHIKIMNYLMERKNSKIFFEFSFGKAFLYACDKNYFDIVKYLLNYALSKKNFYLDINEGFIRSCAHGHLNLAHYLIGNGYYNLGYKDKYYEAFFRACDGGHIDIIRLLVERSNFNPKNKFSFKKIKSYIFNLFNQNPLNYKTVLIGFSRACQNEQIDLLYYFLYELKIIPPDSDNYSEKVSNVIKKNGLFKNLNDTLINKNDKKKPKINKI